MKKNTPRSIFFGKKILIGISGSIAAYKIPELVRLFVKNGAEVKIILTTSATHFVSPLTLSTLSLNDVTLDFVDNNKVKWNNHVKLALWADLFLIAPASCNTIAKMVSGLCDNILLATFLSSKCPVFCAPAMDRDMYLNRATVKNLEILRRRGVNVLDVESGDLASGLSGLGRMKDINNLFFELEFFFNQEAPLFGVNVLITAGPTYEKIDPVRFIGNFSSGKMGCELAKEAARKGANVYLVIGPSSEKVDHPFITRINVETTNEMYKVCKEKFSKTDIAVFAAAVSDFKIVNYQEKKIKKNPEPIVLKSNIDILKTLSKKKKNQFIVGFALETDNEEINAIKKLEEKQMDLIILNSLKNTQSCFGYDTNKIKIIDNQLYIKDYPLMSKNKVAEIIFNEILMKRISLPSINKF